MKLNLFEGFRLNDIMVPEKGDVTAHVVCILCYNKYNPDSPPDNEASIPYPRDLDDWYNWTLESDLAQVMRWAARHMQKWHGGSDA